MTNYDFSALVADGILSGMTVLSKDARLNARSTPEVVAMMDAVVSRLANQGGVKFRKRKMSTEALINAAVMAFCGLPHEQQLSAVNEQLRKLEAFLEGSNVSQPPVQHAGGKSSQSPTARPKRKQA